MTDLEKIEAQADEILILKQKLNALTQPCATLTRGQEVKQLMELDGRPLRVSAEFLAHIFEDGVVSLALKNLPAGTYVLRKKFDELDSWDVQIDGEDCESAFSLELHEAVPALLRDALEKQQR